jgi:CheY-like chemotaxis protein
VRQAQKMEAVGQLAGGIAHDFNNLLTVINGYSQMRLTNLPADDPAKADLEEILKAGKRAEWLVRQLLVFSRKQIFKPKVINLNDLIQDTDKMLKRLIPENVEFVTLTSPDLWVVRVDPDSFHQVLTNLVVNASQAMPGGGKIVIETKNVVLDTNYTQRHVVPPGEYLLLAVSDTGTGVSDEVKAHLFEPFFTTKEKGKGTGLGLSTVYGIVKQSSGYIQVYSEFGNGASFKIYLPRVREQARPWYSSENAGPLPRGTETVLFVEDDDAVRNFGVSVLRQQDYEVLEASSGEQALHLVGELHGKQIHALLTDMVMPGMGGKELADKLKSLRPDIRVIFASGYTENMAIHSGNFKIGEAFLQKPFSPRALAYKIREVLDQQRGTPLD